jgi:uncharacterized protein with PQ loop repeat
MAKQLLMLHSQPNDVIIAANLAALLSSFVVLPQIVKILKDPASATGLSLHSLLLQLAAIALFTYVNFRLGLLLPAVQNFASFLCILLITLLRGWAIQRTRVITLQQADENQALVASPSVAT